MSPQRSAGAIDPELDDQWRAIDGVLSSLAQRSRARRGSDEDEPAEPALRAAAGPQHSDATLRRRLEEVTRERDELRVRLAAAGRQLRSARARLNGPEQPPARAGAVAAGLGPGIPRLSGPQVLRVSPAGAGAARSAQARWLRIVRQHLHRRRST